MCADVVFGTVKYHSGASRWTQSSVRFLRRTWGVWEALKDRVHHVSVPTELIAVLAVGPGAVIQQLPVHLGRNPACNRELRQTGFRLVISIFQN